MTKRSEYEDYFLRYTRGDGYQQLAAAPLQRPAQLQRVKRTRPEAPPFCAYTVARFSLPATGTTQTNTMEVGSETQYGNTNRAFLQAMLARSFMTFRESRSVIAAILNAENNDDQVRPEQVTEEMFDKLMGTAREAASLFDYEIRRTQHQVTKERVYAFVNTASDPQTQLATTFSHDELAFVKRALEAMFDKYNTPRMEVIALTDMQAVKLARPNRRESAVNRSEDEPTQSQPTIDKGLKHSEVERVLENLVGGGWFEKSREGFYSPTPRTLLELRPWLIGTFNYPDAEEGEWQRIKFCEACKDIVTVGGRCAEPDCTVRLHDICEEAFWRTRRDKKCPKCSREWTGNLYVGERAVTSTPAYQRGRRQSGGRRGNLADEVVQQSIAEYEREDQEQ